MRLAFAITALVTAGAGLVAARPRPAAVRIVREGVVEPASWRARDALSARDRAIVEHTLPSGRIRMRSVGRKEELDLAAFDGNGLPRSDAFAALRHFFRSMQGHSVDVDPRLVELCGTLQRHWPDRPLVLVSGYRDPAPHGRNKSYHLRGMAADVAVPGVSAFELYKVAVKLGARGTGLYPSFVHLDVRDVPYRWTGR